MARKRTTTTKPSGTPSPSHPASNPAAHQQSRGKTTAMSESERQALLGNSQSSPGSTSVPGETCEEPAKEMENLSRKSQWIVLAIASGACAAANGMFAKLTTTELTTSFATWIANLLHLSHIEGGVEAVVRGIFFLLNLLFNGIMWTLFTKALARGTSTTQVSIINTSSNFMITAVLGSLIFSESLPPLWFAGAALLVAGNVIIGRREEGETKGEVEREARESQDRGREGDGLLAEEREEVEFENLEEIERERKRREEERDVLELDLNDREVEAERRNDLQLL